QALAARTTRRVEVARPGEPPGEPQSPRSGLPRKRSAMRRPRLAETILVHRPLKRLSAMVYRSAHCGIATRNACRFSPAAVGIATDEDACMKPRLIHWLPEERADRRVNGNVQHHRPGS